MVTNYNPTVTVSPTDVIEVVGVGTSETNVRFTQPDGTALNVFFKGLSQNSANLGATYTGLSSVEVTGGGTQILTLKITPTATTETTSKPVMVPPTSASDARVNVQLQVSTDLKNWEDVAPGEFLGSDALRFFRVKVTTGTSD
jgi:hypothetical protein